MLRTAILAALAAGCGSPDVDRSLPPPIVPDDNPQTAEAIELGRHLFYDARLSFNEAISCSSCHQQRFGFADDRALSLGATGEQGVLNAPTLTNVAYAAPLTWAHSEIETIEEQLLGPMFGDEVIEMGMAGAEPEIAARLRGDRTYTELFAAAFGQQALASDGVLDDARYALASFVRSLTSENSAFDRFLGGDTAAISESARRGSELFYSARLGCGGCHTGFALTEAARWAGAEGPRTSPFHNIGLYDIDGDGGYPESAPGLIAETGIARDAGRFRVPTLRNVAVTAPYMHDGSVADLESVIAIYEAGGRQVVDGPNAGDGRNSPLRSAALADFALTDAERDALVAFLRALTDEGFLAEPRYGNPWP